MEMPSVPIPDYKQSNLERKADCIVKTLTGMNYDVGDEHDAVKIIESEGVNKFNFDYPYGSFEEFKKHVLAGEFDVDINFGTKKDHEELEKVAREGRLWKIN